MRAKVGDELVMEGQHVGDAQRIGTIVEVSHADGTPPFRVRWPDGHETYVAPGPDARVRPATPPDGP
jgi:hypothetical protein